MSTVLKKLNHKPDFANLILNSPHDLDDLFSFPFDKKVGKVLYDFILIFAHDSVELKKLVPENLPVNQNALIWLAYPKKSAGMKSDLSREILWDVMKPQRYRPVAMVSIDGIWSAMRFKPEDDVKASSPGKQSFDATIETDSKSGGAWVTMPFDVKSVFGTGGWVKVKATFDGHEYRGSIADMGTGGHILIITKQIRNAIRKEPGDRVKVELEKDTYERTVDIPNELELLLKQNKTASEFYNSLSFTNRKEYANWISSAKRDETKEKRLGETLRRLNDGIKNPFAK